MKSVVLLVIVTIYCKRVYCRPQGITLSYKPSRPFYATGWTNYPNQIHPPGTPWPASAGGYTTTTFRPLFERETLPSATPPSSTTTTTTTATRSTSTPRTTTTVRTVPEVNPVSRVEETTRPSSAQPTPPPVFTTTAGLDNKVDLSTIATKVPPVEASTGATLFTSAPEGAEPSKKPQWTRPQGPPRTNAPPQQTTSKTSPTLITTMRQSSAVKPVEPIPNNLTLIVEPLMNVVPPMKTASSPTFTEMSSGKPPARMVIQRFSDVANTDLNHNSPINSSPPLATQHQPLGWVWQIQQSDGKIWFDGSYDNSAIFSEAV